jgi:superfamily II DNA or RNA helicase
MAASDPAAVAASDSAGRALLDSAGLITPAVRVGGTKRRLIAEVVSDLAKNGEAILIFTDFVTVADNLLGDLQRLGVRADVFKGGMSDSRRNAAVRAYQGAPCIRHREDGREEACHECHHPNLDCLVLTSVAREGLNLQRTTTLIHFDMPWVPSQVVQRVGRAIRIGSTATSVNMLIPVMRGTIEERVAAVLAPRAAAAIAVLDVHRGIAAENTEMGMSLAGLAGVVSEQELAECADLPLFDLARSLLS